MLAETEASGGRRRSTFYVPLAENRTPSSALDRKMLPSSTPKKPVTSSPTSPDKTPLTSAERRRVDDSRPSPQRTPRTKNLAKSPLKSPARPLVTVTKTIEGPQVPTLMPVQKTASLSASDRLRSPLLKVSTKLLSTSAQALEVINRSPANSPSKAQHSPLSLIRRSSSRKLSRSSSTILSRSPSKVSKDSSVKNSNNSLHVDLSNVPVIMIDQLLDERLLASAADKAKERRHVKPEDEDTAVHSGKLPSLLTHINKICTMISATITYIFDFVTRLIRFFHNNKTKVHLLL